MLLSVVVPCYQVENYIADCLQSLRALEGTDTEILLVDDCGMDRTMSICRDFCARQENMRILPRAQNGGLSAARNTGIDSARGEYIFFLDSDDLCDAAALLRCAQEAKAQSLDILKARYTVFESFNMASPLPSACCPPPTPVMTGDAFFAVQCRHGVYEPMVWQCLYRRQFLKQHALRMPEGLLFEDELFQTPALLYAQRVRMVDTCLIRYRQRPGSIMKSFHRSANWCAHYLSVCRRLKTLCAHPTPGTRMLRRRIGQIALSVAKNIAAYQLSGDIRAQAEAFLRQNKKELTAFALSSGDVFVAAQGLILRISPTLFLKTYSHVR